MDEQKTKKCKYCQTEIDVKAKICPNCKKKQNGKGCLIAILIVVILIVLICVIATAGNSGNNSSSNDTAITETETDDTTKADDSATNVNSYKRGQYKVGTDIPAGEYIIISDSSTYLEISSDSTGDFDSIIANDNFNNRTYITVSDGQYLEFSSGTMYAAADAPAIDTSAGILPEGMYKVGTDIPAGEYKITADKEMIDGIDAYVEVASDSLHTFNSIISNDNFSGEKYISVSDGQYLDLSGCTLTL